MSSGLPTSLLVTKTMSSSLPTRYASDNQHALYFVSPAQDSIKASSMVCSFAGFLSQHPNPSSKQCSSEKNDGTEVVRSSPISFADVCFAVSHPAPSVHFKIFTVFHMTCRQSFWCKRFDLWQVAAVCKPRSCCLQDNWRTYTAFKRSAHSRHALLRCLHSCMCRHGYNPKPEPASKQETAHNLYIVLCTLQLTCCYPQA